MANIIPSTLAREGWVLEDPPTPHIERPAGCSKENQGCAPDCVQKRRGQLTANRSATCERCECMMCYVCANPINRWLSPSGQTIETVTTHTEPRFTFAYNPFDDDMKRMRRTLILEPTLTHAWFRATRQCCNSSGLVVDVGGTQQHKLSRRVFFRDFHAIVLVYDLTNRKSRDNLNKWLREAIDDGAALLPRFLGNGGGGDGHIRGIVGGRTA